MNSACGTLYFRAKRCLRVDMPYGAFHDPASPDSIWPLNAILAETRYRYLKCDYIHPGTASEQERRCRAEQEGEHTNGHRSPAGARAKR